MQNAIKREELFRVFLDRITDGFIILDKEFNYLYINKRIADIIQRNAETLIGKNMWKEFPDAVGSLTFKAFQTAMKEQRFISNIDYYPPLDLWHENYIYPTPDGISVFIRDISEQKRLQKQLREKERDQQFEIMVTGLEAQEKERTSIGRELHDNVNQMLTATKLILSLYKGRTKEMTDDVLLKCIGNLEKAIEENRKIAHELVTPDLKEETLLEQLDFLVHTMLSGNGIKTEIRTMGLKEELLDEKRKLAIYRIAQEQCTNIVKHSGAKHVIMYLVMAEDSFTMRIEDDGKGVDPAKTDKGIGLRNIEGRVMFFDGHVNVTTELGKGFVLEISIPIERANVRK